MLLQSMEKNGAANRKQIQKADISTIDAFPGVPGVSKDAQGSTKHVI